MQTTGGKDLTPDDDAAAPPPSLPNPPPLPDVLERDLTVEEPESTGATGTALESNAPTAEPYNLTKAQEQVRGRIAQWLVVLLAAVIVASFLTLWIFSDKIGDLEKLLTIIFGPIITLVGTAIGYYFGGKNAQDNNASS